MNVVAIIQARTDSKRLPNKVMADIFGKPLIIRLLERVKESTTINDIILATTTRTIDDSLVAIVKDYGVSVLRGEYNDVLDRYYKASIEYLADVIVRITGDCPLIDSHIIDKIIQYFLENKYDYVSNIIEPTYPDGLDVEVFSFKALEIAWKEAQLPSEREHVTPYFINHPEKFKISNVRNNVDLSHLRWTVDQKEDLEFVREIFKELYNVGQPFYMNDILNLLEKHPKLKEINANIKRNEGYHESRVKKSLELWNHAKEVIMDGTQLYSKMACVGIEGVSPIYFVKGEGAYAWDLDGNRYIDYTMGLGPCFVGYNHPKVKKAILEQLNIGPIFSLPNPLEVKAAEALIEIIPCAEMVRFLKTGSEGTQAAVRIARAYTGREKVIKGHYHGWHEWSLAGTKKSGGIPHQYKENVFEVKYNDIDSVNRIFKENKDQIACIIIEPFEIELPKDNYLQKLRQVTKDNGSLLVFDEVVTGFRFALGGGQEYFGVTPDLAVFGKAMGGGLPLSAVVGKKEIMEKAKDKVCISSTFGGELLSLAAFIAVVDILKTEPVYERIFKIGNTIKDEFNKLAMKYGSRIECIGLGPRLDFKYLNMQGKEDNTVKTLFMQEVVKRGIYFVWNMLPSYKISDEDIAYTLNVFDKALKITTDAERKGNVSEQLEGKMPIKVI